MSEHNDIAIKVENVSKQFLLPHQKAGTLKSFFVNPFSKFENEKQMALDGVSFEVKKGEFFGIVGRNGSGKSTLLKCMAGVYTPDKGHIKVNGSLVPFIELGVGFNPELSGRDNVYLNGALLGFSRPEIGVMYQEIVDFAEIEKFMDQKLKNYSSGMQVRLAFSIAIKAKGDILVLDEVLAVGDSSFQQKCFDYFDQLKENNKTVVLVSHDMNAIRQYCSRAILVSEGKIIRVGDPQEISIAYEKLNLSGKTIEHKEKDEKEVIVRTFSEKGEAMKNFEYGTPIIFEVTWPEHFKPSIIGVAIYREKEVVFATNSINSNIKLASNVNLKILSRFGNGRYKITVGLFGKSRHNKLGIFKGEGFTVYNQPTIGKNGEEWEGIAYAENEWIEK